jgi:septal ring factor EnvC (AmiA/AmiB activator)
MKKKLMTLVWLGLATSMMAITMPACPGQQAMQQQIDDLTKRDADLNKRLTALENAVRTDAANLAPIQQAITPMGQQLQTMGPRLDALEAGMKDIQAKMAAAATAPKGKKHR